MTTKRTKTNGNGKKRPTFTVYQVIDRKDAESIWQPIGAAWPHKDAKGFNVQIEKLPVPFDGRLTIRERKSDTDSEGQ